MKRIFVVEYSAIITFPNYKRLDERVFNSSLLIERHPEHRKAAIPFLIPSYSSKANVLINDQLARADLERSSLFVAFIYYGGDNYHWNANFGAEMFDALKSGAKKLNVQLESDDKKLVLEAVFDFSETTKDIQYMVAECPRPF